MANVGDGCSPQWLSFLMIFSLGFLVLTTTSQRVTGPCQFWEDGIYMQNKCFKIFTDQWLDWEGAQEACAYQASSGRLAEPLTARQEEALKQHDLVISSSSSGVWMGALLDESSNVYKWSHNNDSAPLYLAPFSEKGCVVLKATAMESVDCSSFKMFVCEQEVANPCDNILPGAEYFQGSCFLVNEHPLNHRLAQEECTKAGAFLAEPRKDDQVKFLQGLIDQVGHWVGGKEGSGEAVWDTSGLIVEPAISMSSSTCLKLSSSVGLKADTCTRLKSYVCQKDIGDPCELSYPGAVYSSGFCYEFINTPATFQDAENVCLTKNGFITESKTEPMHDFLVNLMMYSMKEKHTGCDPRGSAPVWNGLTHLDLDTSSRWRTDGEVSEAFDQWPEWHDHFGTVDHCAVTTNFGQWEQRACSSLHIYVCQTEIYNTTSQRYFLPLKLWVEPPGSNVPQHMYVTATTTLTSHPVYLRALLHSSASSPPSLTVVSETLITNLEGYHMFLHDLVGANDVMEVRSSHPVTLTLARGADEVMASTLIYPTLHDNAPWLAHDAFFVVASPLIPGAEDIQNKLFVIAVHEGSTKVTIGKDAPTFTTETLQQNQYYKQILPVGDGANGYSVSADNEIVVFFMQEIHSSAGQVTPTTVTQIPPSSLLDAEVVVLPSRAQEAFMNVHTIVASVDQDDNLVAIPFTLVEEYTNLDPQIAGETYALYLNQSHTALDVVLVNFNQSGEFSSSYPAANAFVVQSGDQPFYSSQGFTLQANERSVCTMTPVPQSMWAPRYASILFPSSSEVFDIDQSQVYLYLVVDTNHEGDTLVNGGGRDFECEAVEDTANLSGCTGQLLPKDFNYDKIMTIENPEPFAAYVFVVHKKRAMTCQPLGFRLPPLNNYDGPLHMNESTVTLLPPETTTVTEPPTTQTTSQTTEATTETGTTSNYSNPCPTMYTQASHPTTEATLQCNRSATLRTNLTVKETQTLVARIQKDLYVEPSNTTLARRKKTSAEDNRPSSTYIGGLGVALFSIECAFIIIPDLLSVWRLISP